MGIMQSFGFNGLAQAVSWDHAGPNELYRDLMSVCGLNPFDGNDSSSRKQMFASHIGQALQISGCTPRKIFTGMEREYGKYTVSVKMPCDAQIIKVIERYRKHGGVDSIVHNPETVVIYEDVATKQVGMLSLRDYNSMHPYFGFRYKKKAALGNLYQGAFVKKDTVLLDSPSVDDNGNYSYGRECNLALMSVPGVSEDSIIISRDVLPYFTYRTYETRVVEFGSRRFPLNIHGNDEVYKPHPDIGDVLGENGLKTGLLMALRSYDKDLAVVEQSINALQEPDFAYDKLIYADPGGKIIDIRVHHDININPSPTPIGMDVQTQKYDSARRQFYKDILDQYTRLKRERRENLSLSPEFHRLVVEAISVVGDHEGQQVTKLFRQNKLDDYRVEFVIEYEITPDIGNKFTGCHGDKGVVCEIWEPWQMPVDANGVRADIIMDPNSTISRMNLGRLYEQYFNAVSDELQMRMKKVVESVMPDYPLSQAVNGMPEAEFQSIWNYLLNYYSILSPKTYEWFKTGAYQQTPRQHLAYVLQHGIYLYMPPENPIDLPEAVELIEEYYKPTYGPVTYVGRSGNKVTTVNPVRIGSVYIMLLEKTGDDWTAVSSGKTQHFGVLAQVTNTDKYASPIRMQAIRAIGEAELRIYVSYVGTQISACIMDRSNNPITHEYNLYKLLRADQPTNIEDINDRELIPLGNAKPLQLVKHIAMCAGWEFAYKPYEYTTGSEACPQQLH